MLASLKALAKGIIPADERDGGADAVNAAAQIAERIAQGTNQQVYVEGLSIAMRLAHEKFAAPVEAASPSQIYELLGSLRRQAPAFYKQLRMDVSALYLGNPEVWARIGFPGPSIDKGGYPDFDQPQERARR